MGFLGTLTTFGIGYAAGAVSGGQAKEQFSARVRQAFSQGRTSGAGVPSMDVREIR